MPGAGHATVLDQFAVVTDLHGPGRETPLDALTVYVTVFW